MNCLTEVLGMGLPYNGTSAAHSGERKQLGKYAGMKVMELLKGNVRPLDILTLDAFKNAITIDMSMA
jgi:dihydroxy-acid dehydratase